MTRSPGERTVIENKQATAQLPHCELNIDCNLSNLPKHFITTVSPLCMCTHRSPCAYLKMDFIIPYNFSGGHSPIGNKTPKYQE